MNAIKVNLGWCATLLVIMLFLYLGIYQSGKLFTLDEIDFPIVSHATSISGLPIYYRGEFSKEHLGLYHPPLYIYALAVFIKLLGYSETIVRLFGLLCTLGVWAVSIKLMNLLHIKGIYLKYAALFVAVFFLLHPYTIGNSTLPDIDQTVLPLTFITYIFILIKKLSSGGGRFPIGTTFFLSLFFCINLWAKLTTPLILIPTTFCILLLFDYGLFRSALISLAISVIGCSLFISTYWLYCNITNLPFEYTFNFLIHSFAKGTSSSGQSVLAKFLQNSDYGLQFLNWITLPTITLVATSISVLTSLKNKTRDVKIFILLVLMAVFVNLFYLGLMPPFGGFFKYPYPVFWIFACTAFYAANYVYSNDHSLYPCRCAALHIGIFSLFSSGSLIFEIYQVGDIDLRSHMAVEPETIFAILLISIVFGNLLVRYPTINFLRYIYTALLGVSFGFSLGLSIVQSTASYPTKYEYGQLGMKETVEYLRQHVAKNEIIWSMKDIGYYVHNRYIENYGDIFSPDIISKLQGYIENYDVKYFVVTDGIGEDRIDAYINLKDALDSCCVLEKKFDNFVIFRRK